LVETIDISAAPSEPVGYARSRTARSDSVSWRRGARPSGIYRQGGKRALDVLFVLLGAPFVIPLVGLVALLVALDGGNPFYRQTRVGLHGREFRMLKLRTMVPGADEALAELIREDPRLAEEWQINQKLENDPRITPIGRFLRRVSLDELPQVWNVLLGDMSLVGPRPIMTTQRDLYDGSAYFDMRPGITGLWQVSARNEGFLCRVEYDQLYHEGLSFWTDLRLLVQTAVVVARGTGW
jgi:lipopolysaccharide/colanic/teichoic acid biosynthesis glycosyltransferase